MMLSLLRMRERVLHGLCGTPDLNFQYQIEIFDSHMHNIHQNCGKIEFEELELAPSLKGGIKAVFVLSITNDS